MFTLRVWVLVLPIGIVMAGGSVWTAVVVRANTGHGILLSPTITDTDDDLTPVAAQPHLDVYGNEIEEAVGDYRIDPRGDIYERHSPETEVPRLAPPTI